jgi:hypothetical protein
MTARFMMLVSREGELPQIILALRATRRLPRGLHSREQECDQQTHDRDDNQ